MGRPGPETDRTAFGLQGRPVPPVVGFSPRGPGVPLLARASPAPPLSRGEVREGGGAPLTLISPQKLATDDEALDLARPLPDLIDPGVAVEALDRELGRVPGRPV